MAKEISKDFNNIEDIATHLRGLDKKKTLIFAHNGTGKTRLSMAFKELGKIAKRELEIHYIIMHSLKIYFIGIMTYYMTKKEF